MSDGLRSHIRTYWPLLLGTLSTFLVAALAEQFGIHITGETAFAVTATVMSAAIYSLGRWLETRRWAPARTIGRFLLSLGLDVGKPTYQPTTTPTVAMRAGGERRYHL